MQIPQSYSVPRQKTAVDWLLREAKKLHRAASSESRMRALPVLRRLISSQTLVNISLVELSRQQSMIQRKHLLQMLAREAGYPDWASYRKALADLPAEQLDNYALAMRQAGYPNLWFSNLEQAQAYAAEHGGKALPFASQAVVIPESD